MKKLSYLQNAYDELNDNQKKLFNTEYNRKKKSLILSYILWIIGAHYLYLGKFGTWVLFLITMGGFGIWLIFDLIRMPVIVDHANTEIYKDVLKDIHLFT